MSPRAAARRPCGAGRIFRQLCRPLALSRRVCSGAAAVTIGRATTAAGRVSAFSPSETRTDKSHACSYLQHEDARSLTRQKTVVEKKGLAGPDGRRRQYACCQRRTPGATGRPGRCSSGMQPPLPDTLIPPGDDAQAPLESSTALGQSPGPTRPPASPWRPDFFWATEAPTPSPSVTERRDSPGNGKRRSTNTR